MKRYILLLLVLVYSLIPIKAFAQASSVMIVTVQSESATDVSQEYITLFNTSASAVDITGWRLQYFSASASDFTTPTRNVVLKGVLNPQASYVVASTGYKTDLAQAYFGATLASAGGHIRLISGTAAAEVQQDLLGWGTAKHAETSPVAAATKGHIYERKLVGGKYIDTDNNSNDFTNGTDAASVPVVAPIPVVVPTQPLIASPKITELLPNPSAPQTDDKDEFVELYNPNTSPLNLAGYKLQTGSSFTYSYSLPSTITLAP